MTLALFSAKKRANRHLIFPAGNHWMTLSMSTKLHFSLFRILQVPGTWKNSKEQKLPLLTPAETCHQYLERTLTATDAESADGQADDATDEPDDGQGDDGGGGDPEDGGLSFLPQPSLQLPFLTS